jgi:hypothetical protein
MEQCEQAEDEQNGCQTASFCAAQSEQTEDRQTCQPQVARSIKPVPRLGVGLVEEQEGFQARQAEPGVSTEIGTKLAQGALEESTRAIGLG